VYTSPSPEQLAVWREQLDCGFPQVADVFTDCIAEAQTLLTAEGIDAYLENGRFLGKMGRGVEPVLIFLQEWPQVARILGEAALPAVMDTIRAMTKSPNSQAIAPFLQSLAAIARRLPSQEQLQHYLDLALSFMDRTSGSIHGIHKTYASPSLPDFFLQSPHLLNQLSMEGLRNWVNYGVRNYSHHPERQRDYFSLQSADSRAVLQRERHGTLLVDNTRKLDLYLLGPPSGALLFGF
jgi:nitric oxide reductase NorD protein